MNKTIYGQSKVMGFDPKVINQFFLVGRKNVFHGREVDVIMTFGTAWRKIIREDVKTPTYPNPTRKQAGLLQSQNPKSNWVW